MTWGQLARQWLAKGHTHTDAADRLEAHFGPGKGFSRNRIATLATTKCEPCPQAVADVIQSWEVRDAERWSHYQREMEHPTPEDPEATRDAGSGVATTVRAWLDTAGGTLEAFASQGGALLSALGAKLDSLGALLDSHGARLQEQSAKLDGQSAKLDGQDARLEGVGRKLDGQDARLEGVGRKLDSHGAKLDTLQDSVSHTGGKVEALGKKVDSSEEQRRRDKRHYLAAIFGTGVVVIAATAFMNCQSASSTAPLPPVQCFAVSVGAGQGPADVAGRTLPGGVPSFDLRAFLGAIASGEMGKKAPEDQYVPDKPLPGQKLPPCESRLQEREVNGGCWMKGEAGPPCQLLFRHGDACFRPIAADPQKPVGLVPEKKEQHPAQH